MKPATGLSIEAMGDVNYLKAVLKDPQLYPAFEKLSLERARRVALILGGILITALISVVFAFVQNVHFEQAIKQQGHLKNELEGCVQEAQKQQGVAAENMLILSEANRLAEEQLRACQAMK